MKASVTSIALIAAFVNSVNGYAVVVDPGCDGISICRDNVTVVDGVTGIAGEDGFAEECFFGQTGVIIDSNGFCDTPCEGAEVFDCKCASAAEKKRGLDAEAYFDRIVGAVALTLLFTIGFIQGVQEKRFRDRTELYLEKRDAAKGDETLIDMLPPKPPPCAWFCVCYIIFLILMTIAFVNAAKISNTDFWVGCGNEEQGFFRELVDEDPLN